MVEYVSNTISPLNSINAPTSIWGSSDAVNPEIAIADGNWESLPAGIGIRYVNRNERIRVRHDAGGASDYPYTTTLNIGYGTDAGEFETSDFITRTANVVYDQPTLLPATGSIINKDSELFEMSAPSGINVNHVATDWIFATDAGFSNIVEQSLNDSSNKVNYTLTGRSEDQTIYAKATFIDSSGVRSPDALSGPLTAKEFYLWRAQVKIKAGNGGAGYRCAAGLGGVGYVVLESLTTSPTSPAGTIENYDGNNGYYKDNRGANADGAFGFNGGEYGSYNAGGGGGAGAVKFNGTLLAGVGGGGGGAINTDNDDQSRGKGGDGASLPSADGAQGAGPGTGGTPNQNAGISNSQGGTGGRGSNSGTSVAGGGGGGGFGPGGGGALTTQGDGGKANQGGGGAGSFNQPIGYTDGNYQLKHAGSETFMSSSAKFSMYRAPFTNQTNWELVTQNDSEGLTNLAG